MGPGGVGVGQILRTGPVPAVAERDEQIAVAAQGEAATNLLGPRAWTALENDHLVGEGVVVRIEPRPHHADGRGRLLALEIRQVDKVALLELGIDRDVEQPAMADIEHARDPLDCDGVSIDSDMLEPPRPLGHQERAVGQEPHRPRHFERTGGADRGERALGQHEARLVVGPGGPGLGGRTAERRTGDNLQSSEDQDRYRVLVTAHDGG